MSSTKREDKFGMELFEALSRIIATQQDIIEKLYIRLSMYEALDDEERAVLEQLKQGGIWDGTVVSDGSNDRVCFRYYGAVCL